MARLNVIALLFCAILFNKHLKSVQSIEFWDYSQGPWKSLFEAARDGDVQKADDEIKKGVDVNIRGYDDMTPLHIAAQHGKVNVIEYLIKHGANINDAGDRYHRTPLHLATRNDKIEAVEILLKNGASTVIKNFGGNTPLDISVEHGLEKIEKLLTKEPIHKPWYCFFFCYVLDVPTYAEWLESYRWIDKQLATSIDNYQNNTNKRNNSE